MAVDPLSSQIVTRRLLNEHHLDRIEITIRERSVSARAFPASYHPIVGRRRTDAIAAAGGSISMAQADRITRETMDEVASRSARTISEVLAHLVDALKGLRDG